VKISGLFCALGLCVSGVSAMAQQDPRPLSEVIKFADALCLSAGKRLNIPYSPDTLALFLANFDRVSLDESLNLGKIECLRVVFPAAKGVTAPISKSRFTVVLATGQAVEQSGIPLLTPDN
jgi:hypothetical protein